MVAPAAEQATARQSTFHTLRHRDFRFYWFGTLSSVYGINTEFVALGWLVLQLTNSPLLLGLVGLTRAVPNVALTFVGGALADRVDRKRLLGLTQSCNALLFLILGALVSSGLVHMWHVFAFAFLMGCVRAFDNPSRQAIVPLLVPQEEIANGVALVNVVWQLPRLVGPAVAGIMIAVVGVGPTFFVAGAGMLGAVLFFSLMRLGGPSTPPTEQSFLRTVIDGLNYIRRNEVVLALIGMTFFNSVFGMSYVFLLPIFARDILGVGSQGFGFLQTASAFGAITGILGTARLSHFGKRGWQSVLGAAGYGAMLTAFALSPSFGLSLTLIFLIGLTHQIYMTIINTALLLIVPNEFRGRVMGVYGMTWSLLPLGAAVSGTMAEFAGTPLAVAIGGALVSAMALVVAALSRRVRELD